MKKKMTRSYSKGSKGKMRIGGGIKSWDGKKQGPSKINKGFGRP